MPFSDNAALAADATFRAKVRVAACKVAELVAGETPSASFARDEKRHRLAEAVLRDGCTAKLDAFAWGAASYGTLAGASNDNDIEFVVTTIWNDLAGVSGRDG